MSRPGNGQVDATIEDPAAFTHVVRDALARLHDLPYMRGHPLTALLPEPDAPNAGVLLRDLLLAAIERLRPANPQEADPSAWRRYRALKLRYIDQDSAYATADALSLSGRQARREQHEAIEALAVILRMQREETGGAIPGTGTDYEHASSLAASASIADTVESVRQTLQPLLAERAVSLEVKLPSALSQSPIARVALRQALLAIIVEGIDVGRTFVAITATETAEAVVLRITMGGGLPGRLQGADRVARKFIEASGGRVLLRAAPDGEEVEITFPINRATVLLVDDDPDFVRLFRRCLSGTPYAVVTTWRADEVLAHVASASPDVIVLDVLMPSLDGWELLQKLRDEVTTRAIPILICSVLREESLARALGAAGYLPKPVNPRGLVAALERCRRAPTPAAGRATPADSS